MILPRRSRTGARTFSEDGENMADLDTRPDSIANNDTVGMPRWVKVSGVIAIILVLVFIVMLFTGHGPNNHSVHQQ